MNRQQIYRGPSFYVGWMRGPRIYDNSLSPHVCGSKQLCPFYDTLGLFKLSLMSKQPLSYLLFKDIFVCWMKGPLICSKFLLPWCCCETMLLDSLWKEKRKEKKEWAVCRAQWMIGKNSLTNIGGMWNENFVSQPLPSKHNIIKQCMFVHVGPKNITMECCN